MCLNEIYKMYEQTENELINAFGCWDDILQRTEVLDDFFLPLGDFLHSSSANYSKKSVLRPL